MHEEAALSRTLLGAKKYSSRSAFGDATDDVVLRGACRE